jgi:orotate phosphoribosyltransferase
MHEANKSMRDLVVTGSVGGVGTFATISLVHINTVIGIACGAVTLAAMIPVALSRWQNYLKKKTVETNNPFDEK